MIKHQKKFTAILLFLLAIGILAVFFYFSKNEKQGMESLPAADPEKQYVAGEWQDYRNEEYGFAIKYSGSLIGKPAPETINVFSCGKQLGDVIGVAAEGGGVMYEFAIYSNPQNMSAGNFFLCRMKGGGSQDYDEAQIKTIGADKIGEGKIDAASFALFDSTQYVLIPSGENMIEIKKGKDANPDEFRQMLESFVFFEPGSKNIRIKNAQTFCADKINSESGEAFPAFSLPLGEGEMFIVCAKRDYPRQTQWIPSPGRVTAGHLSQNASSDYRVSWQGVFEAETGDSGAVGNFNWDVFKSASNVGDIDQDGWNEILLEGGNYSSTEDNCLQGCANLCLYSPQKKDIFCVSACSGFEKIDTVTKQAAAGDCPVVKTLPQDENSFCQNDSYGTVCFKGDIMKSAEYKIYRDYLQEKATSEITI